MKYNQTSTGNHLFRLEVLLIISSPTSKMGLFDYVAPLVCNSFLSYNHISLFCDNCCIIGNCLELSYFVIDIFCPFYTLPSVACLIASYFPGEILSASCTGWVFDPVLFLVVWSHLVTVTRYSSSTYGTTLKVIVPVLRID